METISTIFEWSLYILSGMCIISSLFVFALVYYLVYSIVRGNSHSPKVKTRNFLSKLFKKHESTMTPNKLSEKEVDFLLEISEFDYFLFIHELLKEKRFNCLSTSLSLVIFGKTAFCDINSIDHTIYYEIYLAKTIEILFEYFKNKFDVKTYERFCLSSKAIKDCIEQNFDLDLLIKSIANSSFKVIEK